MNSALLPQDLLQRYFSPKRFRTRHLVGRTVFEVVIKSPDLRALNHTTSDDWGQRYQVELPLEASFVVRYWEPETGLAAQYTISPPTVNIEAPTRASERQRYPFAMTFMDAARGLRFRAVMGSCGSVKRVDIECVHDAFDVPRLLFREHARRQGPR